MKKLYLDEMVKYDKDIESLYTYKSTLLTEKDYINNEYAIIQVSQKYYLIFILYIFYIYYYFILYIYIIYIFTNQIYNKNFKIYYMLKDQLITQRNLYKQLKEEQELNEKKAFLERIENFRRNHAAKIIQQNWKLYYMRVSMRKKKGRK